MSYILIVNTNQILWDGAQDSRWTSVFLATAIGTVIGTLLMTLYAKMPFAQASSMGLNSMLGGTMVIKYFSSKDKSGLQKPKYDVSIVALIVFALFLSNFLVPIS